MTSEQATEREDALRDLSYAHGIHAALIYVEAGAREAIEGIAADRVASALSVLRRHREAKGDAA